MKYRPDIDGLRAVAVVPVVLYHLGTHFVPGGYVGVDVFFVISGYLITQLLSAEIHAGHYSIQGFYARRARRIFPALFLVCTAYSIFALCYYVPNEVDEFRRSLAATTLFSSNFYFYFTQSYFAPAAATRPLLHTWSLAVEEQFYIFFPLLLLIVRRRFAKLETQIFISLAIASLLTSAWLLKSHPSGAFYLPQSRAWELLTGSLLAIRAAPAIERRGMAEVLAFMGIICIGFGVFLYTDETPFPGLSALIPCIGTALILHSGSQHRTILARLLALAPVRFIGLISYSLYLWHWPIDVALRYFSDPLGKSTKIAALILSFALATLSWHFVEKPFRRKPYRISEKSVICVATAAMITLVSASLMLHAASAKLWGLSGEAQKILALLDYDSSEQMRSGSCFLNSSSNDFSLFDQQKCLHLSTTRKNYLLVGDSHAADLWAGISRTNLDINVMQATASGCRPILRSDGLRRCVELMHFVFDDFLPKHHLDAIIFSGRWMPEEAEALKMTVKAVKPYADRIIVFGPTVEYRHPLPRTVVLGMLKHDPSMVQRDRVAEIKKTDDLFDYRLQGADVDYFSVYRAICPGGQCRIADDDQELLEFDYGHFTLSGSIYIARQAKKSGML